MRMPQGTAASENSIDGFITNTANYTSVEEVYLPNADLNTYVDQSRVDRRPHRDGWCNQIGAGSRYRWLRVGQSDGVSSARVVAPIIPRSSLASDAIQASVLKYKS